MQNIIEILKGFGIEVPEDKQADLRKQIAANYKTVAEFEQKTGRLEQERDAVQQQLTAAQETLKSFEGVDLATIQQELETWKTRAAAAEKDAADKIAARDFEDALKAKLDGIQFTSAAARKAVQDEIRGKGLKLDNGVILGLDDALKQIREADADAFFDDDNPPPAKFTAAIGSVGGKQYKTPEEIFAIKDSAERQAAIAANPSLFTRKE